MEKMHLTKENINKLIMRNTHNLKKNKGGFGIVLPYDHENALKFSADLIKENFFDEEKFNSNGEEYKIVDYQISRLASSQEKIKLSTLPKGVAYFNNKPVAVIIKYFYNHKNLYDSYVEYNNVLYCMLKQTNDAIAELMENGIYQLDAKASNFLYSKPNYKVETIDLDGELVFFGEQNIMYEERIYKDLIAMHSSIFKEKLLYLYRTNQISKSDYLSRVSALDWLKYSIRDFNIYESADGFVNEVKREKLLELKK